MKNRPKIGIIHHPFYKTFHGIKEAKTYLGSVETGLYYSDIREYMDDFQLYDIERSLHYLQPFQPKVQGDLSNYEIKVICTLNRFGQMQTILDHLKPSVNMRIGGAGNKIINLLDEYADLMCHVV